MRWPNRHPHSLTSGMRKAQHALARFLPLVDWTRFSRRNLSEDLRCDDPGLALVGCGDKRQAFIWAVRSDSLSPDGTLKPHEAAPRATVSIPHLEDGNYTVITYDTLEGEISARSKAECSGGVLRVSLGPVQRDLTVAVLPANLG